MRPAVARGRPGGAGPGLSPARLPGGGVPAAAPGAAPGKRSLGGDDAVAAGVGRGHGGVRPSAHRAAAQRGAAGRGAWPGAGGPYGAGPVGDVCLASGGRPARGAAAAAAGDDRPGAARLRQRPGHAPAAGIRRGGRARGAPGDGAAAGPGALGLAGGDAAATAGGAERAHRAPAGRPVGGAGAAGASGLARGAGPRDPRAALRRGRRHRGDGGQRRAACLLRADAQPRGARRGDAAAHPGRAGLPARRGRLPAGLDRASQGARRGALLPVRQRQRRRLGRPAGGAGAGGRDHLGGQRRAARGLAAVQGVRPRPPDAAGDPGLPLGRGDRPRRGAGVRHVAARELRRLPRLAGARGRRRHRPELGGVRLRRAGVARAASGGRALPAPPRGGPPRQVAVPAAPLRARPGALPGGAVRAGLDLPRRGGRAAPAGGDGQRRRLLARAERPSGLGRALRDEVRGGVRAAPLAQCRRPRGHAHAAARPARHRDDRGLPRPAPRRLGGGG